MWWRIGLLGFGGPAGQIALMHRIIVDEKRWLDEKRFMHALNYCMLLPGPEAQQLAIYVGWLLHGVRGGLVAGVLFVLPGALAILALSWVYVLLGDVGAIQGLFLGLKAAVLAIVVQALIRIGSRTLVGWLPAALAAGGFAALFVFDLPFPLVILGAALLGLAAARHLAPVTGELDLASEDRPGTKRAALACLLLWIATVGALFLFAGAGNVYTQIATFFSTMALVTFGGAYAVLAYLAQQAVETYGWMRPGEMVDGLGLAETTPGPLILVTQFVGFLAAYREAAFGPALLAATLGAVLTTWVTFLPCFLWIFGGAPYIERLRGNRRVAGALAGITATVVGVIANLALWFALHLLWVDGRVDRPQAALTLVAFALLFGLRLGVLPVLAISALLGIAWMVAV